MEPIVSSVATAGAGGGWAAFKYNRSNYIFDQTMRYQRYTAGYSNACAQAGMYREDIRDMTGYTVAKQDVYHIVGVIFYVITIQLIMAGRLGVHGPVPPGWLMGIHYLEGGLMVMFLTLSTWLAMHASARGNSGMAYMLTRSVRLPIPTPSQLDRARASGCDYEKETIPDQLRVPLVLKPRHRQDKDTGDDGNNNNKNQKKKYGTKDGNVRLMPMWYDEETRALYHTDSQQAAPSQPEHFERYRGLQQEWWMHDIYARIALTYFMSSWMHGAAYYIQSHCFGELRAIWPAWSCSIVLAVAHWCVLKTDIQGAKVDRPNIKFPMENIAPFTPIVTVLGMSLEYSIIKPSQPLKWFIYVIAWVAYIIHFLWALRMYDLAVPKLMAERRETPTQPWWPGHWWMPAAFADCFYLVAPPKSVPDEHACLQQQMKAARHADESKDNKRRAPMERTLTYPSRFPWKVTRGALLTMILCWVFLIVARAFEQIHGERMLFKQEGRVERWPSHMQPWMPPWTRRDVTNNIPARDEWCHTGGCDRRLSDSRGADIAMVTERLQSVLQAVSETLDHELASGRTNASPATSSPLRQAKVDWPEQLFRPSILACGNDGTVAAFSSDHRSGVTWKLPQSTEQSTPSPFSLHGLNDFGEILGASLGESGLLLTTGSGAVAECVGADDIWSCSKVGTSLPTGGSGLKWAAAARRLDGKALRAAVAFDGDDGITLFDQMDDIWEPAGQVRLPMHPSELHSFSMSDGAEELLIAAKNGGVHRWQLDRAVPAVAAAPVSSLTTADLEWQGSCGLGGGRLAHLASRATRGDAPAIPELFISART